MEHNTEGYTKLETFLIEKVKTFKGNADIFLMK